KTQAARENKDLLLYFGGSDWCPNDKCVREKYMARAAVNKALSAGIVVVEFDDPRYRPKPPNHALRKDLVKRWKINGVPSMARADAEGRPYSRFEGLEETWTPDTFLNQIGDLRKARTRRDEMLAKAAGCQGIERAVALDQTLGTVPEEFAGEYPDLVREIVRLDPTDQTGLRSKYLYLTARYGIFDDKKTTASREERAKWE